MTLLDYKFLKKSFKNKRVVIMGSAPNVLENKGKYINKFDYVIRINNYKIKGFEDKVGDRCDVFYSFFGSSIKKMKEELIEDGVKFCMCKCPDAFCFEHNVAWDKKNRGSDFRWVYENRRDFWFCPVYIPTKKYFIKVFHSLGDHIPTTGFACILELIECQPQELYITGFDGFSSKIHNVNEPWREKHLDDPIRHIPGKEIELIRRFKKEYSFIKGNI
jgi:hypothetical protein